MSKISRFGVSIDSKLLTSFDQLISEKGYTNRSEALRDLIREYIVETEWKEESDLETMGVVTLVYNHELRELADKLTDLQHQDYKSIISTLHVHLDEHNCLEVLVVKGKNKNIKNMSGRLIGTKGVKHGKLIMTTLGKDLS
jgi:CopG family transcriptional regulator, nickel-responsive regulator